MSNEPEPEPTMLCAYCDTELAGRSTSEHIFDDKACRATGADFDAIHSLIEKGHWREAKTLSAAVAARSS